MEFETRLVNLELDDSYGATNTPVYLNNSFAYDKAEDLEKVFQNKKPGYTYSRINNPSIRSVEQKLAALEGGQDAILTASGMAAISTATLNILQQGDHFIASSSLFGGTYNLFKSYRDYGIEPEFSNGVEVEDIKNLIRDETKFVFVETLGNPKLDIPDIKGLAELCEQNKIPLIVDNTMATPALVNPIELGADLVIHSTSKYINGTANSIGGVIIDAGSFDWSNFAAFADYKRHRQFAFLAKARSETFRNLGGCASPMNSFLNEMGLTTLALRMERHSTNALKLANFLITKDNVKSVNYPGLESSEYHKRAQEYFAGGYGGILTVRLASKELALKTINKLNFFHNLANIGDVKSLVIHPASTIYSGNTEQERKSLGVADDLLRINVGIENISDLKNDFEQALCN